MSIITQSSTISKWQTHKLLAEKMAKKLSRCGGFSPARANRMLTCGDTLTVAYCPSCGKTHAIHNNRCRDRLCPLCNWRLSIQRYHEMLDTLKELKPTMQNKRVAMLTLTIRNIKPYALKDCLKSMSKAWKRLYQAKIFEPVWGWARCTEITYNITTKTCHPHMHILLIWENDNLNIAETMATMKSGWKAAARLGYQPIIDLREAYSKEGDDDIIAAAGEAFAYSIKPATTAAMSLQHLKEFADAIAGYRFISYGGSIKRARMKLGLTDADQITDHNETICKCGNKLEHMVLAWSAGGYQQLEPEVVK